MAAAIILISRVAMEAVNVLRRVFTKMDVPGQSSETAIDKKPDHRHVDRLCGNCPNGTDALSDGMSGCSLIETAAARIRP
jgi:hypothetical protein